MTSARAEYYTGRSRNGSSVSDIETALSELLLAWIENYFLFIRGRNHQLEIRLTCLVYRSTLVMVIYHYQGRSMCRTDFSGYRCSGRTIGGGTEGKIGVDSGVERISTVLFPRMISWHLSSIFSFGTMRGTAVRLEKIELPCRLLDHSRHFTRPHMKGIQMRRGAIAALMDDQKGPGLTKHPISAKQSFWKLSNQVSSTITSNDITIVARDTE